MSDKIITKHNVNAPKQVITKYDKPLVPVNQTVKYVKTPLQIEEEKRALVGRSVTGKRLPTPKNK